VTRSAIRTRLRSSTERERLPRASSIWLERARLCDGEARAGLRRNRSCRTSNKERRHATRRARNTRIVGRRCSAAERGGSKRRLAPGASRLARRAYLRNGGRGTYSEAAGPGSRQSKRRAPKIIATRRADCRKFLSRDSRPALARSAAARSGLSPTLRSTGEASVRRPERRVARCRRRAEGRHQRGVCGAGREEPHALRFSDPTTGCASAALQGAWPLP
jgi:hypothetical protein